MNDNKTLTDNFSYKLRELIFNNQLGNFGIWP